MYKQGGAASVRVVPRSPPPLSRIPMVRLLWIALAAVGLTAGLAACDAASDDAGRTHVTVRLTDNPFPFDLADSANVSIARVELLGTDTTGAEGRVVLYDGAPLDLNLLDLRDGVDTTLTGLMVPTGDFRQLRLILAGDARVVFNDGRVFTLAVPSGQQTGIKVNLPEMLLSPDGDSLDVLVDFDVERSFIVRGGDPASPGFQGFTFRPVLQIASLTINGDPVD